jgi:hypothetical protein
VIGRNSIGIEETFARGENNEIQRNYLWNQIVIKD